MILKVGRKMASLEIVMVEDDKRIIEIMRLYLEKEGYTFYAAVNAAEGMNLIYKINPDVLLLDIHLPDENGYELAKEYRKISNGILIFITGERAKDKLMLGFEVGCDDYMIKPFDPSELLVRLKAHLKRFEKKKANIISIGNITINFDDAIISKKGKQIELSTKEKMLLFYLAKHPNQVLAADLLYDQVWGYDSISDLNTVKVHICTLRKKIEDNSSKPKHIHTVRGFGYKFTY